MAQPGNPSRGFGGRILSVAEVTVGTTPSNPAFLKFSDLVQSVSVMLDPATNEYRDIGDFDPAAFVAGLPSYGVKVSYVLYANRATQLNDAINRLSNNGLTTYTIEVATNLDGTTSGYFTFTGAAPESVSVHGEVGKPAIVDITYKALACARATSAPSVGSGSRESAALSTASVYSASTMTRGGSAIGYITRSIEVTVAHALSVFGTDAQTDPKAIFAGARTVTGKVDISLDDGGVAIADATMAMTGATILMKFGATGAPQLTVNNAIFDKLDIPLNVSDGLILAGVPFKARSSGSGAIATGTVP